MTVQADDILAIISRFDSAVGRMTYLNRRAWADASLSPAIYSTTAIPPQLAADHRKALEDLRAAAGPILKVFQTHRINAEAIFAYLMDADRVRPREPLYDLPVLAAIENLKLHALGGEPVLPMSSQMYPASHFAAKFGISTDALWQARKSGRLSAEKRGGRWFYRENQVREQFPDVF